MRVFTSPAIDAIEMSDDFVCTTEGELLSIWDCPCDCSTCPKVMFTGFESGLASSLAVVSERADINREVFEAMVRSDLAKGGWSDLLDAGDVDEWVEAIVDETIAIVNDANIGDIVERTPSGVEIRPPAKAA